MNYIWYLMKRNILFSPQDAKAQGELKVWDSSRRLSVRPSTVSNMNISETSRPIVIKFHQKLNQGGKLPALVFELDWIRNLVSMVTDSSHRVIMEKIV